MKRSTLQGIIGGTILVLTIGIEIAAQYGDKWLNPTWHVRTTSPPPQYDTKNTTMTLADGIVIDIKATPPTPGLAEAIKTAQVPFFQRWKLSYAERGLPQYREGGNASGSYHRALKRECEDWRDAARDALDYRNTDTKEMVAFAKIAIAVRRFKSYPDTWQGVYDREHNEAIIKAIVSKVYYGPKDLTRADAMGAIEDACYVADHLSRSIESILFM